MCDPKLQNAPRWEEQLRDAFRDLVHAIVQTERNLAERQAISPKPSTLNPKPEPRVPSQNPVIVHASPRDRKCPPRVCLVRTLVGFTGGVRTSRERYRILAPAGNLTERSVRPTLSGALSRFDGGKGR